MVVMMLLVGMIVEMMDMGPQLWGITADSDSPTSQLGDFVHLPKLSKPCSPYF